MRASLLGLGLVLGFALACGGGSTPAIQTVSQWPCPDCEVTDVDVRGPIAYIAGGKKGGLVIVDLSDPSAPKELARMPVEGSAISVRVDGTTAYLGVFGKGGLVTFDVSDPSAPKQLGQHGGGAYFVEKKGDYVFVPGTVYDVSDPSKPERVAALPGSNGNGAWLEGDTLYVGASTNGFRMVDISDPKAPKLLGEMESKYAKDAAVKGDFVFVPAQNDKVVQVVDATDKSAPKEVARIEGFDKPTGVAVHADTLYVADGRNGLRRYDISDPKSPKEKEAIKPGKHDTYKVFVAETGVFGADGKHLLMAPLD